MGALLVAAGIFYLIYKLVQEANTKPVPRDIDWNKAYIDSFKVSRGEMSKKQYNKNLYNGTYRKK